MGGLLLARDGRPCVHLHPRENTRTTSSRRLVRASARGTTICKTHPGARVIRARVPARRRVFWEGARPRAPEGILGGRASPRAEVCTLDVGLLAAGGDASPPISVSPRAGYMPQTLAYSRLAGTPALPFPSPRAPGICLRRWPTRGWRGRQPSHFRLLARRVCASDVGLLAAGGDASPPISVSPRAGGMRPRRWSTRGWRGRQPSHGTPPHPTPLVYTGSPFAARRAGPVS
jgi:hypothetical protein